MQAATPAKAQDTTAPHVPDVSLPTLQALMADLQRAYPHAGARVDHAAFLLLARRVERSLGAGWWVGSEMTPEAEYLVLPEQASCTCQDFARHGSLSPCKHQLAVLLYQRAERVEAEAQDPTTAPIGFELTERAFTILATLHVCSRCSREARRVNVDGLCPACTNDDLFGPVA